MSRPTTMENQNFFVGRMEEVSGRIRGDKLLEQGEHAMLVYDSIRGLCEVYSAYAETYLPENEIILLATQYETVDKVKQNLIARGVELSRYTSEGTLMIVDAQQGYMAGDIEGTFKLALTLASRAEKEKRRGLTWIGDIGSFFAFKSTKTLMVYELTRPGKFGDERMKTICCYHKANFETLPDQDQGALLKHHSKSISVLD